MANGKIFSNAMQRVRSFDAPDVPVQIKVKAVAILAENPKMSVEDVIKSVSVTEITAYQTPNGVQFRLD